MMAQRAPRRSHRGTGPAVHVALEHGGTGGVGEEAERLDGWAEQRDHVRAHAGRHVHHPGVARYDDGGARETCARFLQRQFARHVDDASAECSCELAVRGTTDRDDAVPELLEASRERLPMRNGPALGGVCSAGGDHGERFVRDSDLGKPVLHVRA